MSTDNDIKKKKDAVILHASKALELLSVPADERTPQEENELISSLCDWSLIILTFIDN